MVACSSDNDSGAPETADSSTVDAPAHDGGSGRGIFFTQQHFRANFAAAEPQANRRTFADAICQRAASDAALAGTYRAVLAIDSTSAIPAALGSGPFCPIANGAPSCRADNVVFTNDVTPFAGPEHALTTDQAGNATNPSSTFFSGLGIGPDDGDSILTCQAWASIDAQDGRAGGGRVVPASGASFGDWVTGPSAPCDVAEQPLLCIQAPE